MYYKLFVYVLVMCFWATVCKTVCPMLAIGPLSCLPLLSVTLVYCGQTVPWIKMELGVEVGLGPGNIVLDGDPVPQKGHKPPIFGPCLLWPKGWMDQDATWYGGRHRPWRHCVGWGSNFPKKGTAPPIFGPCLLWPNGWIDQDATWRGDRTRPRPHCVKWRPSPLPRKGSQQPPLFGACLLWQNGRPSHQQLLLSTCWCIACQICFYYLRQWGCFRRLSVCLLATAQKLLNRFAWNFQGRLAMGQRTND